MLRLVAHAFLIGLLVVSAFAPSARADNGRRPDKKVEAKNHYESAIRKFDSGKYDEAADEFVAAYELVGESAILYNIAQAYRLGERFEKSAQFYRNFLRHMGDVTNRREIEGRIIEMDERAANQRRQSERREADKRLAQRKAERKTSIPYTESQRQGEQSESGADDSGPRPGRGLKIFGYTLCALSGVALGMGIGSTIFANQASQDVENAAAAGEVFTTELRDTQSKGQLYDTLAIVGYSVGGAIAVGGALAIYFGFRAERHAGYESETPVSERKPRRPTLAMPLLAPSFSPGSAGLVVLGRF